MTRIEPVHGLHDEIRDFKRQKRDAQRQAGERVALFVLGGIDLAALLGAEGDERRRMLLRLERLIERERQRGARRHWSYDLNRHIALKQARDHLRTAPDT